MKNIYSAKWEKFMELSGEATNSYEAWKAYLDRHYDDVAGKVEIKDMHEYLEVEKKKDEAFKARNNAFLEFEVYIRNSILNNP